MAFRKTAKAIVQTPGIHAPQWSHWRHKLARQGTVRVASTLNLAQQAGDILGEKFDPDKYLLTHCTLVSSVDTEEVPNVKLGSVDEGGKTILRKWSDYRITPETEKFANNNHDAWSRGVLLKSYRTFVGGHNFCFAPGTEVLMGNGTYRTIEQVQVGDEVWTHAGRVRKVVHKFERQYEGEVVRIHTDHQVKPLVCTPNHGFFVGGKETEKTPAEKLLLGDLLPGPLGIWSEAFERRTRYVAITYLDRASYKGQVYNLEVDEDHSYIVEGVSVGNCEHVQIEEQSKGRILDAVARDIGPSVYVDLLVATHRKHADLIRRIEDGSMSTLSMGCFLPDAQVTLGDGRRVAIQDVQPGDLVRTHAGVNREVMHKYALNGTWSMRRMHVRNLADALECTANHPLFVMRPLDACACGCGEALDSRRHIDPKRRMRVRFKVGHDKRLFNPNNTYSLDEYRRRLALKEEAHKIKLEEVRADEVRPGDFLCYPRIPHQGTKGSREEARLLGYFLAEGSYIKSGGKRVSVEFNFSLTEKDTYVAEVVALVRKVFPDAKPWVQERVDRTSCMVHVSGAEIAEWFFCHCGEYSHSKRISTEVMETWSQENLLHLAGAWLNGDVGLARTGKISRRVSGSTVSYELACQLHSILMGGGIFCAIRVRDQTKATTVKQLVNGGRFASRDEDTGRFPSYHIDITQGPALGLHGYTDKIPTATDRVKQANILGDFYVFEVEEVETYQHEGWVFDLSVDEVHSYIVDGAAVHNCTCSHTTCTKCGNVGFDETNLCDCVRYNKGNTFFDSAGRQRKIIELCGHESENPTGGVNFIEASWVEVPAFTGAVMRNIIDPQKLSPKSVKQMKAILEAPPKEWVQDEMSKAARGKRSYLVLGDVPPQEARVVSRVSPLQSQLHELQAHLNELHRRAEEFDFGDMGDSPDSSESEEAPGKQEDSDGLSDLINETEGEVLKQVKKKIKDKIAPKPIEPSVEEGTPSTSHNIIKDGGESSRRVFRATYLVGLGAIVAISKTSHELLDNVFRYHEACGKPLSRRLYRAASIAVGSPQQPFTKACVRALGRKPTEGELKIILRLGQLLASRTHNTGTSHVS